MIKSQDVDGLATWQLRDYRADLERAIDQLPAAAPIRQVYAGRLAEVITEQEARQMTTGLSPRGAD